MNKSFVQIDQATINVNKIKSNKYDKEYILLEQIGKGTEGTVYKGEENSPAGKEIVAIKFQRFLNQIHIIEQFSEKKFNNLINVRDIISNPQGMYLVMDYADGEFYKYMSSFEYKQKTPREKCDLFIQIVQGVEELHEIKMIHRDLKPENILYIRKNGTIQLKLCDFGLIKYNTDLRQTANIGTPYYWAPEMISDTSFANYTEKVDIWALGMMWHEMITGKPMLNDFLTVQNIQKFIEKMNQSWINEQIDKVVQFLPKEKEILKTGILTINPNQRISARQMKEKLMEIINFKGFSLSNYPSNSKFNQPINIQQQFPQPQQKGAPNPQSNQKPSFFQPIQQQQIQLQQGVTNQFLPSNDKITNFQVQFQFNQQQTGQPNQQPNNERNLNFPQQNENILQNSKEFSKTVLFHVHVNSNTPNVTQQKEEFALKKIDELEQKLQKKESELLLLQAQNQDIFLRIKEFIEIKQNFNQQKDQFQLQLGEARKKFEDDFSQLKLRIDQLESSAQKYKSINTKNLNEFNIKEQQYIQEIKQIKQNNEDKNHELNLKIQKLFEEKELVHQQKFEIETQLKLQQCKENTFLEKIDLNEKQKISQEKLNNDLQKSFQELNQQIQQKEVDFQFQKQKLDQSISELQKENLNLQNQILEKDQQQKNLTSNFQQQQIDLQKKFAFDQNNEKNVMLRFLIKIIQQILQFQSIFYSDKLKKFDIPSLQEQSADKQYIDILIQIQEEQKGQADNIQRIEHESLQSNPDQLAELFLSVQKIILNVGNNLTKNYQNIQNLKFKINEQREIQAKQQKQKQESEDRLLIDLEFEKHKSSQLILNEVQETFLKLTAQITQKLSLSDLMKQIWTKVMMLQNQFGKEFFQAIQSSIKQPQQIDSLTNFLKQLAQRYKEISISLFSQVPEMKPPQMEHSQELQLAEWAKEICRMQDELENLEKLNQDLNINIADLPEMVEQLRSRVGIIIGVIQTLKKNESVEINRAKTEFLKLNYQSAKLCIYYLNLSPILDLNRDLQDYYNFIEKFQSLLNQNQLLTKQKLQVELQIKNSHQKIKKYKIMQKQEF